MESRDKIPETDSFAAQMIMRAMRMTGLDQHLSEEEQKAMVQEIGVHNPDYELPQTVEAYALPQAEIMPVEPLVLDDIPEAWRGNYGNLGRGQLARLSPRIYSFGKLRPALFREHDALVVVFLQLKGGVGKTTHALNLATTAALDGAELWLQVTVWESLRQAGIRPLLHFKPEPSTQRRLLSARLELGLPPGNDNAINYILAPEVAANNLGLDEAESLLRVLRRRTHLLILELGAVDLLDSGGEAAWARKLLRLEGVVPVLPWTPSWEAWEDAEVLRQQLREIGGAGEPFGVGIAAPDGRRIGPDESLMRQTFGDNFMTVPYIPLLLEERFAEQKLPLLSSPQLLSPYREMLEKIVGNWLRANELQAHSTPSA